MSYSDFTLTELENKFNLIIQERVELFPAVEPVNPSPILKEVLAENIPLALEINTEKARSEMIVAPVLIEIRKIFQRKISLFSGRDFNIDKEKGLNGRCDFLISHSPRQLEVTAPVAMLVEAKNDNLQSAIPQCIAEMLAAQIFNEQKQNNIPSIYGGVTTGSLWQFLKLEANTVYIEAGEHFIGNIELLLGILSQIIHTTLPRSMSCN
ncbi:MAG: hypothetical protein EBE86_001120 [Hormoscilla sp. GUM202]|nr:hypothetical protein [Hormoscilla sp. GUM202]